MELYGAIANDTQNLNEQGITPPVFRLLRRAQTMRTVWCGGQRICEARAIFVRRPAALASNLRQRMDGLSCYNSVPCFCICKFHLASWAWTFLRLPNVHHWRKTCSAPIFGTKNASAHLYSFLETSRLSITSTLTPGTPTHRAAESGGVDFHACGVYRVAADGAKHIARVDIETRPWYFRLDG